MIYICVCQLLYSITNTLHMGLYSINFFLLVVEKISKILGDEGCILFN